MDQEGYNWSCVADKNIGIYIHIPFCKSKCLYCDFSSFPGQEQFFTSYLEAILKEITLQAKRIPKSLSADSVYFGGGTPAYFPDPFIEALMCTIRRNIPLNENSEITVEMNPENGSMEKFSHYLRLGINRLSIGFQSLDDHILSKLGRTYDSEEALRSFWMARAAGFSNISVDMIAGLPGHTVDSFHKEMEMVVSLKPEHISLYLLECDRRTQLVQLIEKGTMSVPNEDTMVQLYEMATNFLLEKGYIHYEISNFSKPSKESHHNTKYWTDKSYIGFGSSAHSYVEGRRYSNVKEFKEYIRRMTLQENAMDHGDPFKIEKRVSEALLTGLRLIKGIEISDVMRKYGIDIMERYGSEISHLAKKGLLEKEGQTLRLTHKGIIFSNEVFSHFV